jgi:hypothetical protein
MLSLVSSDYADELLWPLWRISLFVLSCSKLSQLRYPEALSAVAKCNVVQKGVCSSHRSRTKTRWESYSHDECLGCVYLVVKVHVSSWFALIWQHLLKLLHGVPYCLMICRRLLDEYLVGMEVPGII